MPYLRAARFAGERPAGHAYEQAQRALYARPDSDVSVYRLQLNQVWHVAALGEPPPVDLADTLERILASGEPVPLPDEVLMLLRQRRAAAILKGPWIERHHRPGERL
jgi:hypothetical protein